MKTRIRFAVIVGLAGGALTGGCKETPEPESPYDVEPVEEPVAVAPVVDTDDDEMVDTEDTFADLDEDMAKVIAVLDERSSAPMETLSVEQARREPTIASAVKSVLRAEGESSAPEEVGKVTERTFAGADGRKLPARVYTPKDAGTGPLPVVLYFHGGGWVVSDIDAYDASARSLANETGAIVVSAHYRQGPEHKFPAAHDDAFAAYRWVTQNAPAFGGDPRRIAVAGESAGGNLAANVAIKARDSGMRMPAHMLLVYPVASGDLESGSAKEHANAKPLSKDMMFWFAKQYFNSPADALDARIDLVNANLAGLPPTTIVNAEFDPLLSGGELLADRLEAAGVDVEQKTYEGVTHEFFGTGAVVEEAREAMDFAAGRVEASLESPTKPAPRRALPPPGASRSQGRPVGVLARTR